MPVDRVIPSSRLRKAGASNGRVSYTISQDYTDELRTRRQRLSALPGLRTFGISKKRHLEEEEEPEDAPSSFDERTVYEDRLRALRPRLSIGRKEDNTAVEGREESEGGAEAKPSSDVDEASLFPDSSDEEYLAEDILAKHEWEIAEPLYLVKWAGRPFRNSTWELECDLSSDLRLLWEENEAKEMAGEREIIDVKPWEDELALKKKRRSIETMKRLIYPAKFLPDASFDGEMSGAFGVFWPADLGGVAALSCNHPDR